MIEHSGIVRLDSKTCNHPGYQKLLLSERQTMSDSRLSSVTGGSTIDHNSKITKLIVDPHEADSFVIDLLALQADSPYAHKPNKDGAQDLRRLEQVERSKVISKNLRRFATTAVQEAPPTLGTVAASIDGGNHAHVGALLPEVHVTPPMVKVYFDMPGLATLNYKYHGATVVPGYLVLTTDMRYSGPGEFYPFTSKLALRDPDSYIGVMVEGIESLFLIKPPTLQHKFGPYEHCLVPILQEKALPPELKQGIVEEKGLDTSPKVEKVDREIGMFKFDGVL